MCDRRFIAWLNEPNRIDLVSAGGKGVSLGEMICAGLPVPEGFVVLTEAYHAFIRKNNLQEEICKLVKTVSSTDTAALEATSKALQQLFYQSEIPTGIVQDISAAYAAIGGGSVVVRSSATTEDLPGASFAGQHDSFLNIESSETVCDFVRRCWASLWNARAISYRKHQGFESSDVALAVVVQRMIDADRSGVLFTANPLNHRRDQMLVSASFGLGEAVVSGKVSPDQWVLTSDGLVVETHIADKQVITVRKSEGSVNQPMPPEKRRLGTLTVSELAELAKLGCKAAQYFGSPQDIEWAWADGKCYLLQSRPITSLFPLPEPLPDPDKGLRLYLCFNVHAQQMLEPITPMGIEYWRALVGGFAHAVTGRSEREVTWLKVAGGRMFADITELLRKPGFWPKLAEAMSDKDPITGRTLLAFRDREGDKIIGRKGGIGFWWRIGPLLVWLGWRGLMAVLNPEKARIRLLAETNAAISAIEAKAAELTTMQTRVDFIRNVLGRRGALIWITPVAVMNPGLMAEKAVRSKVGRWLGNESLFIPVQRALPHNVTTEMGLALWRLAQQLKTENTEPVINHPGVKSFLSRFGHRAVWEIDPGIPRWNEEPTYVLDLLRSYMDASEDSDQETLFIRQKTEAEVVAADLIAQVRRAKGILQASIFAWQIRCYRELAGLREQPKFEGARMIAIARQVMLQAGADLALQGLINTPDDVFFLTLDDLLATESGTINDLRPKVDKACAEYHREMQRKTVPRWVTSTGECIFGLPVEEREGVLVGQPVSAGQHEGQVRVVLYPVGVKIKPGEVIVCHGTDPAWTPLFLSAGALVMETGGAVSHGSIVAREYGLPAVAGVANATTRLFDGQRVRVNGETGEVLLL